MKVEILQRERVYDDFLKIEEATVRYEQFGGGMSPPVRRLSMLRGDAVAAVIRRKDDNCLLLVRQFRYPIADKCQGWLTELVAGMLAPGEEPKAAMRREIEEEMGYRVTDLEPICRYFASPGGSDESLYLFYGEVSAADKCSAGGGLLEEGEDIALEVLPVKEVAAYLDSNHIQDAKTYMGLSWFLRKK